MIREEGLENVFARHTRLSGATKDALVSMGFTLFPKAGVTRSDSLTVCAPPKGLRVADLVSYLNDEFRLVIAKGLGSYANELIRVSNIGSCYPEDMLMFFSAVECAMRALGFSGNTGEGTARFIESYLGLNTQRN
jgi:aspartate aminotransferase-like enzyme